MNTAREALHDAGFRDHDRGESFAEFKRQGTQFTLKGDNAPIKARIDEKPENETGLDLSLGYDTFVLFDTGDLDQEADRLHKMISGQQSS